VRRCLPLALLGILLAAACVYNYQAETPETRTWPAAGVATIDLRVENGALKATGRPDTLITALITKSCRGSSQADAEQHLADIVTGDSLSGTTLWLYTQTPNAALRNYTTRYDVTCPPATALHFVTVNGAVEIDSMAGTTVVAATNGAVTALAHDGSITVEAVNGAIDCDVARLDSAEIAALHAANGRVTLRLPADASVAFDIQTTNGTVAVTGFSNVSYTTNEAKHKAGTIGTGLAAVTLRSENGNVTIQTR
jgi:DUF4097 and DUF4098 domain-containing protein YvlB